MSNAFNNVARWAFGSVTHKMGARQFLKIAKANRAGIEKVTFIVPKLGASHLGYFRVQYHYAPTTKQTTAAAIESC